MRIMPLLKAACLSLMLSACVAPLLMMSPTSQLMWALLKPLVGFDPNEVNLFEQPLIKDRMTAILGPNYDTTMQLLKTANELQQEGPLFYVISRYAPVPDIAKQAGMVWNSQTNQMSVLLQKGDGSTQTFGENLAATAPVWPSAMQSWQSNPITQAAATLSGAGSNAILGTVVNGTQGSVTDALSQQAGKTIADTAKQGVNSVATSTSQAATKAVTTQAKQVTGSAAATVSQEATKAVTTQAKQATGSAAATVSQEATKAITTQAKQTTSSSAVTVNQEAAKAVTTQAKQATSSAAATVSQEATKAVTTQAKQATSSAAATVSQEAAKAVSSATAPLSDEAQTEARTQAEAELEALFK
ncbi:hypothetical protein ACW5WK_07365 [Aeromonas enteropelogenes]|uniref:hypothetical protein n=1 Tax=Aeromonas enteropelogenes TaxID=29489 RepID=UPI0005AA59F9|nr:hypothetical protein [Aeromonas enteropelogenes]UBH55295.1 hypothetical protein LA341_15535 [Aeromonas enteropelogenes]